jgi:hypothetical protein
MEHISFSQRQSHTCSDSVIHEYPSAAQEARADVKVIDVGERHPAEGLIENGEGIAILQIIKKYGRILNPDSEQAQTPVHAGDQVYIMPNERYALEGPMSVVLVTSPAE